MTDVTALALAQVLAHCGGSRADAVRYLGAAIAAAPGDGEAYDQLAELWHRSQAEVAPVVEAGGSGGVVAALAFVRFLDGHYDEAVLTLGALVGALPQVAWAEAPWFGEPTFTGSVGADAVAEAVLRTADGGHDLSDAALAPVMAPWFALISAVAERAPVPVALARMAMVLRRCGRTEESLALCTRADEVERVALTEVVRAGTFRVLGDVAGAVRAFERAIDLDPRNWSLHLGPAL
jgi:tetratricopeptide (TPR) repeat protein